jgi:hypothetical protein
MQSSDNFRREDAEACLSMVIPRVGGASSIPEALGSCSGVSGIQDREVKPGDDSGVSCCLKIESECFSAVVPAKAGTHNLCSSEEQQPPRITDGFRGMGPGLRRDDVWRYSRTRR